MPDRPYSRQTKSPSRLWLEEKDTRNVLTMKLKKLQEAKDPQSEKFVCWCRRAATPISSTSHAKNKLQIGKLLFCFEKRNSYGFIFIVFIYLSRWSGDRNEKNVVVDCYGFSCLRGFFPLLWFSMKIKLVEKVVLVVSTSCGCQNCRLFSLTDALYFTFETSLLSLSHFKSLEKSFQACGKLFCMTFTAEIKTSLIIKMLSFHFKFIVALKCLRELCCHTLGYISFIMSSQEKNWLYNREDCLLMLYGNLITKGFMAVRESESKRRRRRSNIYFKTAFCGNSDIRRKEEDISVERYRSKSRCLSDEQLVTKKVSVMH